MENEGRLQGDYKALSGATDHVPSAWINGVYVPSLHHSQLILHLSLH